MGVALHFTVSIPRTDAILVSRKALLTQDTLRPILLAFPAVVLLFIASICGFHTVIYLAVAGASDLVEAITLFRYLLEPQEQREILNFCRRMCTWVSRRLAPSR